jgi:magnesium-transporting ATPase (P-type)
MAAAQGHPPVKSFIEVFIVIIVANVPQGLPATVTSCLTVCAQVHARDGHAEANVRTQSRAEAICVEETSWQHRACINLSRADGVEGWCWCAQRLAGKNMFVKRLDCVEALGSCTVIASDKTGASRLQLPQTRSG